MRTKKIYQAMTEMGIKATSSSFERRFYGFDVTPLPAEAYWAFRGSVPQVVVRPKNTEEVSKLLSWANESKVAITPRGGGTSGYFQSVPRRAGITVEMLDLDEIDDLNTENGTVRVGAGAIWSKIETKIMAHGFRLKTYPTSYRSSTVAGWMQTEGFGIGSIMYGHLKNLIREIEIVLPTGQIASVKSGGSITLEDGASIEFDDLFHSEGMLAIITSVVLEVRKEPETAKTFLLMFNNRKHFSMYAKRLSKIDGVFFMEFVNGAYMDLLEQADCHAPKHTEENISLVLRLEGSVSEVNLGSEHIKAIIAEDDSIEQLPDDMADEEYEERLDYFRIKNAFCSVTPADVSVPTESLNDFLDNTLRLRFKLAYKGEMVTPDKIGLMFFMVLGNELSLIRFMSTAPYQMEIILRALKYGGSPHGGIGLLNTPYVYSMRTKDDRDSFISKKEIIDEQWIMNPGKWTDPPFFLRPSIYFPAMKLLEPVCWLTGGIKRRW